MYDGSALPYQENVEISARTVERVEAKRQRRLDGQSLVVNGDAIAAAWKKTVTTMRTAGVVGQALTAAESIGNNFLQFRRDRTGEGQASSAAGRGAVRGPQAEGVRRGFRDRWCGFLRQGRQG